MAVRVRVGKDDHFAVAKPREVEVLAEAAAERRDEIGQLLVLEHLRQRRALGVEHLAAQRQDRLTGAIASLLGRPAGRVTLDDEDLAVFAARRRAVAQLPWQGQPVRRRGLPRDLLLRGAAGLAGARGQDDPRDDRFGHGDVRVQPVLERGADLRVDGRGRFRVVEAILRLALKLRLLQEDAQHARRPPRGCLRR